MVNAAAMLV